MAKHVCSCHGTRCFQKRAVEGRAPLRKKQEGSEKKNPLKESGGHMSPSLLSILVLQDLKPNIDAEDEDKVEQSLNGGEKMSVSLAPACSLGSKGKDDDPDLQSQAPLSYKLNPVLCWTLCE